MAPDLPTLPTELVEQIFGNLVLRQGESHVTYPDRHALFRCALASHAFSSTAKSRLYRDLQLSYSVDEGLASASWNGPSSSAVVANRALVRTVRLVVGVRAYASESPGVDRALAHFLRNMFREDFALDGCAVDFGGWLPGPLALAALKDRLMPALRRLSVIQLLGPTAVLTLLQGCTSLEQLAFRKLQPVELGVRLRLRRLRVECDETTDNGPFDSLTSSSSASLQQLTITLRPPSSPISTIYPLESFSSLRELHLRPADITDASWTSLITAASTIRHPALEILTLSSPFPFSTISRARALTTHRLLHRLPSTLRQIELAHVPIELDYLLYFIRCAPSNRWKRLILGGELVFGCKRRTGAEVFAEVRAAAGKRGLQVESEAELVKCFCDANAL